jgi:hypothetical protein
VVRKTQLDTLGRNVRKFFGEFKNVDFKDLAPGSVQKLLDTHGLGVKDLWEKYAEKIRT